MFVRIRLLVQGAFTDVSIWVLPSVFSKKALVRLPASFDSQPPQPVSVG